MPEAAQRRMLELVPFAAARNPNDVTGQFLNGPTLLDQAIELAATNGGLRERGQLPGVDRAECRPHGGDPRGVDRAQGGKPRDALRGRGVLHPGLHARPRDGGDRGVRRGDPRDARDPRPSRALRGPSGNGAHVRRSRRPPNCRPAP